MFRPARTAVCAKHRVLKVWHTESKGIKRPRCRVCKKEDQARHYERDIRGFMLAHARTNARLKGVPFAIVKEDIVVPMICPVFGTELKRGKGRYRDESPSLDRINPALGYVPGNIQVISWRANDLKRNATVEEIRLLLIWMEQTTEA